MRTVKLSGDTNMGETITITPLTIWAAIVFALLVWTIIEARGFWK